MTRKYLAPGEPREMEIIEAFLEHLRRAGRTDATIHARREVLERLNRELPYGVGQTSTAELAAWLYRDEWSANTKATYYSALRAFYLWATNPKDLWLTPDPTVDLEPCSRTAGVARPVTNEELARILAEAAEPFRTWAIIAAYQGLRCIEISRLDRQHVTEERLFVVRGKGNRPRVHDTDPYVWAAVKDLPPGPVARDDDGERATPFHVSIATATYFRHQLKLPGVGLHRLRHWLGVTVQEQYKNIRVTQELLGHASLSSTQIYTRATDEQQRAARASLPRLAG